MGCTLEIKINQRVIRQEIVADATARRKLLENLARIDHVELFYIPLEIEDAEVMEEIIMERIPRQFTNNSIQGKVD